MTGGVNGTGDFVSSAIVGIVWSGYSPVIAFAYAVVIMATGAIAIRWAR